MSTKTKPDIDIRDTPNSTSNPEHHSHKGIDVNISVPVHIKNVSIGPKLGHTSLKYKTTTNSYNNFGVAQDAQTTPKNFDDSYIGLSLRYEDRFFVEIEPRKYIKSKKVEIGMGVGINIGF